MNQTKPHISIAPMMDWTDRHCRNFHRLLSPNVRLYTEMVTTGALLHGDSARHLLFNPEEHYVALQLGGSEPEDLAQAAKMGEGYGYDEINLNCGCPSERVQKGAFGACLMREPETVARCVEAMARAVNIPVTVKCRIGVDDVEAEPFLRAFINTVSNAGCGMFIIHARKAWLKGLSPKENREIPPLDYDLAARMGREFPDLQIILNGGIKTVGQMHELLHCHPEGTPATERSNQILRFAQNDKKPAFHGLMIGREAYQNPGILLDIERELFGNDQVLSMRDAALAMIPYIERQMRDHDVPMKSITRHMIGLFSGQRGSRTWRRALSIEPHKDNASPRLLERAVLEIV
jgi:tRNA-dihydrouridine synthase A